MSLDVRQIGVKSIFNNHFDTSLHNIIGKAAALQEVSDKIKSEFYLTDMTAADVTSASVSFTTSWVRAAEAAERAAEVAGRANLVDASGSKFQIGEPNATIGTQAGGSAGDVWSYPKDEVFERDSKTPFHNTNVAQHDETVTQNKGTYWNDIAHLMTVWRSSRAGTPGVTQGDVTTAIWDGNLQITNMDDLRDAAQVPNRLPLGDYGRLIDNARRSEEVSTRDGVYGRGAADHGVGIEPQDYQTIAEGAGLLGFATDGIAFARAGTRASAADIPGIALSNKAFGITFDGARLAGSEGKGDRAAFEENLSFGSQKLFDSMDDMRTPLDVNGPQTVGILESVPTRHGSIPTQYLRGQPMSQGDLPARSGFHAYSESDLADGGPEAAGGYNHFAHLQPHMMPPNAAELDDLTGELNRLENWAKTSTKPDIAAAVERLTKGPASGVESAPAQDGGRLAAGNSLAVGDTSAAAGAFLGAADVASTSGPPGWLVALTGAVVMELSSTGFHNHVGSQSSPMASRQSELVPSGTRSNPLHVKVLDSAVSYQTHMPAGPTASLPSQSLPIPGQVLFSP